MKLIKNIFLKYPFLIFTIFAISHFSFAQNCTSNPTQMLCGPSGDANGNGWKWWITNTGGTAETTDNSYDVCEAWVANLPSPSNLSALPSPFISTSQPTKIGNIRNSEDFTPSNGWVLVKRNFGCFAPVSTPSFILYNRERGLLRAYFYIENSKAYNAYRMQLEIGTISGTHGALAFASDEVLAQDKFAQGAQNGTSDIYTQHYITENTDFGIGDNTWIVGDFELAYNRYLFENDFINPTINILAIGVSQSTIEASITGSSQGNGCSAEDFSLCEEFMFSGSNGQLQNNASGLNFDDLENGAKSVKQVVKAGASIAEFFAEEAEKNSTSLTAKFSAIYGNSFLTSQTTFKQLSESASNISKVSGVFKKISKVTNELPGILSAVSTVAGLLGLTEPEEQLPTLSTTFTQYNLSLTGEITAAGLLGNTTFYMPGGTWNNQINSQPYYQCPVGMGSLETTPQLDIVNYERIYNEGEEYDIGLNDEIYWNDTDDYKSIRVANDLKFSYPANGPTPTSVQASFVVTVYPSALSSYRKTDFSTSNYGYEETYNLLQWEIQMNSLNLVKELDNGQLVLISPALDIADFKGKAINVPQYAKVQIAIVAVFDNGYILKKNYQYDANETTDNTLYDITEMPPYANYSSLLSNLENDIIIENKTNNFPAQYRASGSITIKPNTTIATGSSVKLEIVTSSPPTGGNGMITSVSSPYAACYNTTAQSARMESHNVITKVEEEPTKSTLKFWPNPAENQLYITLPAERELLNVVVYNVQGEQVTTAKTATVPISNLAEGVYFVEIQLADGERITKKIIISRN